MHRRGPQLVARLVLLRLDRAEAIRWWQKLISAKCRSVRICAQIFDCTEQTARNWIAGFSCPTGDAVLVAVLMWPEAFAGLAGHFRGR